MTSFFKVTWMLRLSDLGQKKFVFTLFPEPKGGFWPDLIQQTHDFSDIDLLFKVTAGQRLCERAMSALEPIDESRPSLAQQVIEMGQHFNHILVTFA